MMKVPVDRRSPRVYVSGANSNRRSSERHSLEYEKAAEADATIDADK
jgi:hypothetical protein